jgi:hypothetical protein
MLSSEQAYPQDRRCWARSFLCCFVPRKFLPLSTTPTYKHQTLGTHPACVPTRRFLVDWTFPDLTLLAGIGLCVWGVDIAGTTSDF